MISLIIARTTQHSNCVECGYHQAIFYSPAQIISWLLRPMCEDWVSKAISAENKVLFFNFRAISIRVSVVYLASTLVFTYLFKGKKCLDMIYGLQQERNFLCGAPNLKGCGVRSHWPYKYHGPALERGWIFIQSVSSDLWYALLVDNTFHFTIQRKKNPLTK